MPEAIEQFRCAPLAIWQRREACADRHVEARRQSTAKLVGSASRKSIMGTACIDCAIGRAHHAGEKPATWDGGAPIELRTISSAAPPSSAPASPVRRPPWLTSKPKPRRALPVITARPPEKETSMSMPPRMVTHKGVTKSLGEWSAELGLSPSALRSRLERGVPIDAPLDPRAAGRSAGAKRAPQKRPARPEERTAEAPSAPVVGDPLRLLERLGVAHELLSRTPAGVAVFFPSASS